MNAKGREHKKEEATKPYEGGCADGMGCIRDNEWRARGVGWRCECNGVKSQQRNPPFPSPLQTKGLIAPTLRINRPIPQQTSDRSELHKYAYCLWVCLCHSFQVLISIVINELIN